MDVVVVGAGFSGAVAASIARRAGAEVLLVERGRHPRFAVGESTTPLSNLLLSELDRRWNLPWLGDLSEYGRARDLGVGLGLKRGFSFFDHTGPAQDDRAPDRRDQLLVAASPNDRVADTQWLRSDVDAFLVERAREIGVVYRDSTDARWTGDALILDGRERLRPTLVIDAGGLPDPVALPTWGLPDRHAVFAHLHTTDDPGEVLAPHGPYPVRWSAQHHLVPGGWVWSLRFDDDRVSVGAVLRRGARPELERGSPSKAWMRLLDTTPGLSGFRGARVLEPWRRRPSVSFRRAPRPGVWTLPSAAAFIDPLLATGFALTLLALARWDGSDDASGLESRSETDVERAAGLVGALIDAPNFETYAATTMAYFAAVSWEETRVRLGYTPGTFLAGDHPTFGAGLDRFVQERPADVGTAITELIAPIDVAGLRRPEARGHYPIRMDDLRRAAPLQGWDAEAIERVIQAAM